MSTKKKVKIDVTILLIIVAFVATLTAACINAAHNVGKTSYFILSNNNVRINM